MTNLSWFILAADILGSLKGAMIFCAVAFGAMFLAQVLVFLITEGSMAVRYGRTLVALCIASAILSAVFPQRSTMLMIAATEAGVTVAQSESGQAVFEDTVKLLRKRLKDALGEDEKK